MSSDDVRLLEGEARRALGRLKAIRILLERQQAEPHMTEEYLREAYELTREERG